MQQSCYCFRFPLEFELCEVESSSSGQYSGSAHQMETAMAQGKGPTSH